MPNYSLPYLFLPAKDRSYWRKDPGCDLPLLYLAWGHRNFFKDPIPVTSHEGWVFMLVEKGWPTLWVKEESVPMAPNSIVLIGPSCSYGWKPQDAGECKIFVWMWRDISNPILNNTIKEDGYATNRLDAKSIFEFIDIHRLCRQEIQRLGDVSKFYFLGCQQIFETNLIRTLLSCANDDAALKKIEVAVEWMSHHLDSREPISRLCDYLDVSQSTLHRLYSRQFNESPMSFFNRMRMNEAAVILKNVSVSIKAVAFQLGYEHFNDFSRAFKKHSGFSPSDFRKVCLGKVSLDGSAIKNIVQCE